MIYSDQGQNFKSHILGDLCKAFGVNKSHTTPYHPMGNGLVERMNRSLLTLLRTYVEREEEWETHLQLSNHQTYHYRTLTLCTPSPLQIPGLPGSVFPDPAEYSATLRRKLYDLRELVDANTVHTAGCQHSSYESSGAFPQLKPNQQVLLSNPTRGKLGPHRTGPWTILYMKNPTTVQLRMGAANCTFHINRVRPLLLEEDAEHLVSPNWTPPLFTYKEFPLQLDQQCASDETLVESSVPQLPGGPPYITRSGRVVKPVERYGVSS